MITKAEWSEHGGFARGFASRAAGVWGVLLVTLLIFGAMVWIGIQEAGRKSLWTDEVNTQDRIPNSYIDLLTGRAVGEANRSPLFYVLQKSYLEAVNLKWIPWAVYDYRGDLQYMITLRIPAIVCMAAAVAFGCWFYARDYSIVVGMLHVASALTTYVTWAYLAEARPYALWFFLSTVHLAYFLKVAGQTERRRADWPILSIAQFGLAFTIPLSVVQITGAAAILWFTKMRKPAAYFLATVLQVLICIMYGMKGSDQNIARYFFAPHGLPHNLFFSGFPAERLVLFMVFAAVLFWACAVRSDNNPEGTWREIILRGRPFVLLAGWAMAAAIYFLVSFQMKASPGYGATEVPNRYFVYLAPYNIVTTSFLAWLLARAFRQRRNMRLLILGLCILVFSVRIMKYMVGFGF